MRGCGDVVMCEWITKEQAGELVGRSPLTVRDWCYRGWVESARVAGVRGLMVNRADVLEAASKAEANRQTQRRVAGPGRGKREKVGPSREAQSLAFADSDREVVSVGWTHQRMRDYIASRSEVVESGCWQWTGTVNFETGYSQWTDGYGHRSSWQAFNEAEIPQGYEIDHLCRIRSCVNPGHLELVTHRENSSRRGRNAAPGHVRHRGTADHCWRGHEWSEENTYIPPGGGSRMCRQCSRINKRRSDANYREALAAGLVAPQEKLRSHYVGE